MFGSKRIKALEEKVGSMEYTIRELRRELHLMMDEHRDLRYQHERLMAYLSLEEVHGPYITRK